MPDADLADARAPGARRLSLARALLGGAATAALLPDVVRARGGDASTCLRLAAVFAIGCIVSEIPAAVRGDRVGSARRYLFASGVVQAIGLAAIALAPDLVALTLAVFVVGIGAGASTGAEARAALAIGASAKQVARLEVLALVGKAAVGLSLALIAISFGVSARGAIAISSLLAVLGALVSSTVRVGDRVHAVPRGRRVRIHDCARRLERRSVRSIGVLALLGAACMLGLAARGTDPVDAFAVLGRGGGLLACTSLLAAKGIIARALAPTLARAHLHAIAIAGALASVPLVVAPGLPTFAVFIAVGVACGLAGGAAAAARGVLLVRLGPERVGTGAAIEATVRRAMIALFALIVAPLMHAGGVGVPYVAAGAMALVGAVGLLLPRTMRST